MITTWILLKNKKKNHVTKHNLESHTCSQNFKNSKIETVLFCHQEIHIGVFHVAFFLKHNLPMLGISVAENQLNITQSLVVPSSPSPILPQNMIKMDYFTCVTAMAILAIFFKALQFRNWVMSLIRKIMYKPPPHNHSMHPNVYLMPYTLSEAQEVYFTA